MRVVDQRLRSEAGQVGNERQVRASPLASSARCVVTHKSDPVIMADVYLSVSVKAYFFLTASQSTSTLSILNCPVLRFFRALKWVWEAQIDPDFLISRKPYEHKFSHELCCVLCKGVPRLGYSYIVNNKNNPLFYTPSNIMYLKMLHSGGLRWQLQPITSYIETSRMAQSNRRSTFSSVVKTFDCRSRDNLNLTQSAGREESLVTSLKDNRTYFSIGFWTLRPR